MTETPTADNRLISDEMRALQGKILQSRVSYPISASDIRRWATAVYYPELPPARYIRAGLAAGEAPLVAPEEFNPFAWCYVGSPAVATDMTAQFIENRAGITPPPLQFIVNGGSVYQYGVAMKEGDVIQADERLKCNTIKHGKRGPLLFTELEESWTNQRGEVVRTSTMTLVRY